MKRKNEREQIRQNRKNTFNFDFSTDREWNNWIESTTTKERFSNTGKNRHGVCAFFEFVYLSANLRCVIIWVSMMDIGRLQITDYRLQITEKERIWWTHEKASQSISLEACPCTGILLSGTAKVGSMRAVPCRMPEQWQLPGEQDEWICTSAPVRHRHG